MMKTVTAYETRDGKVFTDQEEAVMHEAFLDTHQIIEECLNDFKYQGAAQRAISRQAIMHWEKWRRGKNVE
jgi:hypothetical protein